MGKNKKKHTYIKMKYGSITFTLFLALWSVTNGSNMQMMQKNFLD